MKLLFIVNDADFFVSHRLGIAQAAKQQGYDVHVATENSCAKGILVIKNSGLNHHVIAIDRSSVGIWNQLRTVFSIFLLIIKLKPNITHLISLKPVLYGGLILRFFPRIRCVFAITGLGYLVSLQGSRFIKFLILHSLKFSLRNRNCKVIVQNSSDREILLDARATKREQIYKIKGSGVDLLTFSPTPLRYENPEVIMMVSRMLWPKGVGDYFEASRIAKSAGEKWQFVLVGGHDPQNPQAVPKQTLEKQHALGIVKWMGHREDVSELMKRATILVFPSFYGEGVPKGLLEAFAIGRPVIACNTPGFKEVISDGVNGILIPVGAPDKLVERIKYLIDNPEKMSAMSLNAQRTATLEFDVEKVVHRHLEIYKSLLN